MATPFVALGAVTNISEMAAMMTNLLLATVPVIFAIATVMILWGLANYFYSNADEEGRRRAKDIMFWGIIGLFLMFSIWGLARVLNATFGIAPSGTTGAQDIPQIPPFH